MPTSRITRLPLLHIPFAHPRKEKSAQPPPRALTTFFFSRLTTDLRGASVFLLPSTDASELTPTLAGWAQKRKDAAPRARHTFQSSVRTSRPSIVNGISLTLPFAFAFPISSIRRITATVTSSVLGVL